MSAKTLEVAESVEVVESARCVQYVSSRSSRFFISLMNLSAFAAERLSESEVEDPEEDDALDDERCELIEGRAAWRDEDTDPLALDALLMDARRDAAGEGLDCRLLNVCLVFA
jgi:hypothetical protein